MVFREADALRLLDAANDLELDDLQFGVIRLDRAGVVTFYNASESTFSGLPPVHTIGRHFFSQVGPCMNNEQVAQRYEKEPELDATIDFVLALRMKRTPVRLRLLRSESSLNAYLLVEQ
jgi:photoactive yellow protein